MKKKILFLIHDLGQGGAEKVLVNLVNNLDRKKFDISVTVLFGGGVNEQFLKPDVHFHAVFSKMIPGNSKLMKMLTPRQLHRLCVKERYDIEVSYLEGPSARVISGCEVPGTKLVSWIHSNHFSMDEAAASFRSASEAAECYGRFDRIVCVSQYMKDNFCHWMPVREKCAVLYNTVESDEIRSLAEEPAPELETETASTVKLVAVGTLKQVKGFDRLLRIVKRLKEDGRKVHLYLLGRGPLESELRNYTEENHLEDEVSLLGYQANPYKYVAKCDIMVCSSYSEGFSTAVTEALVVGTAVCTVNVSGMTEMLGEHNEYGIVTDNDEEALYQGIRTLLENNDLLERYKAQAEARGKVFQKEQTVGAVEEMLLYKLGENDVGIH
ncbi:MAG: glycosyltransferase [Lachnospiraceae bacterium]|nr:glycosyltransferase [Lachnospiraceae bacterium]